MKNFWNRALNFVGRTGVALFAIILFIHGSTKNSTNVNNDAELEVLGNVMSVADEFELSERLLAADEGVASTADLEEITVECVPDDTATNEDSGATVSAAEIAQGWRVRFVAETFDPQFMKIGCGKVTRGVCERFLWRRFLMGRVEKCRGIWYNMCCWLWRTF